MSISDLWKKYQKDKDLPMVWNHKAVTEMLCTTEGCTDIYKGVVEATKRKLLRRTLFFLTVAIILGLTLYSGVVV